MPGGDVSNVVKFRKKRRETIRGAARSVLTEAMASVKNPQAVVIVALGRDGSYAFRSAICDDVHGFDVYSRAGAAVEKERMALID
jgi:hypothetical protein